MKLVIASVLKPVDDIRMYEKISLSLAKTNKYEINIIGFSTKKIPNQPHINFHPIFTFPRLSLKRLLAPIHFFILLRKINPEVVIVTTYELLLSVALFHWSKRAIILYDIQENYAKNVLQNHGIPWPIRYLWAKVITCFEWGSRNLITHYLLAEKGYLQELTFLDKKYMILENKVCRLNQLNNFRHNMKQRNEVRFLYSGTITRIYGIYQAIQFFLDIRKLMRNASFIIIGHFPYKRDYEEIRVISENHPSIIVKGSLSPVPHAEIWAEIENADFGIVSHQPVPSIENCFPTRIYEYMAFQLPIILQDHPLWSNYCNKWDAALSIDFNNYDDKRIVQQLNEKKFYPKGVPHEIFWENEEEKKLVELINELSKSISVL